MLGKAHDQHRSSALVPEVMEKRGVQSNWTRQRKAPWIYQSLPCRHGCWSNHPQRGRPRKVPGLRAPWRTSRLEGPRKGQVSCLDPDGAAFFGLFCPPTKRVRKEKETKTNPTNLVFFLLLVLWFLLFPPLLSFLELAAMPRLLLCLRLLRFVLQFLLPSMKSSYSSSTIILTRLLHALGLGLAAFGLQKIIRFVLLCKNLWWMHLMFFFFRSPPNKKMTGFFSSLSLSPIALMSFDKFTKRTIGLSNFCQGWGKRPQTPKTKNKKVLFSFSSSFSSSLPSFSFSCSSPSSSSSSSFSSSSPPHLKKTKLSRFAQFLVRRDLVKGPKLQNGINCDDAQRLCVVGDELFLSDKQHSWVTLRREQFEAASSWGCWFRQVCLFIIIVFIIISKKQQQRHD